jgi:hypothetical protein
MKQPDSAAVTTGASLQNSVRTDRRWSDIGRKKRRKNQELLRNALCDERDELK